MGKESYDLSVIYLAERPSAKIISETLYFEPDEIEDNWKLVLTRRDSYQKALDTETVPTPFTTAASWLCENCRYRTICDAIALLERREQADGDIKVIWQEE